MSALIIAPDASDDLDAIWEYYGLELQNPDPADRVRNELFDAMRLLAKSPQIGHFRSDLSHEPLRFWHVRSYLIIYARRLRRFRSFAFCTLLRMSKRSCEKVKSAIFLR